MTVGGAIRLVLALAMTFAQANASPVKTGRLDNPAIREASGLADSLIEENRFWVVNDGGDAPVLYAIRADGAYLGSLRIAGAENVDWEDLDSFELDGTAWLLVADIGDNHARRDFVTLYLVREPERALRAGKRVMRKYTRILRYRYPDGPRDAEGVSVDATSGQILIISKRTLPVELYALPLSTSTSEADTDAIIVARRLGDITTLPEPGPRDIEAAPFTGTYHWQPTALDIRPDAKAAIILTTRNAYLYQRQNDEPWPEAFRRSPRVYRLPPLDEAEAVTFFNNGRHFLVTSEKPRAPLYRFESD